MSKDKRVAVIGAGLGGLASAALLAKAGYSVDVFDRLPYAGGKAGSRTLGAYRFDTGPSLFTMPWVFEDFFASLGERMSDRLRPIPLEPICNYFWPDGTRLSSWADRERFGAEVEAATGSTARELEAYLDGAARVWDIAGNLFLRHSLHEASTYLSRSGLSSILRSPGIDPFRSLHQANTKAFRDPRMAQLFDRYATYNGSDPFRTPATMRIVPHVEYTWGGWAVEGGIVSVPRAIEGAARDAGAKLHLGTGVDRILHDGHRVTGLRVAGEDHRYDMVVSNADVLSTYRRLLDAPDAPEALAYGKLEPSSSGLVFLWGMKKAHPELQSHNIFFSGSYTREFADIFGSVGRGEGDSSGGGIGAPADPTVYINITSRTSPEDAPAGGENWFVLVNASSNRGQDWNSIAAETRKAVLARLEAALGRDAGLSIEEEAVMTPADIERDTGSTYGSLYGIASNDRFSAFFRHPNRSRRIKGLYFAGGSAHPGGGMPLAVLSGTIAAELARKYEDR
ncbi:MAG: phytoene desaturase family protein [Spirochaetia bacterium]|jgi:phytoene desaturase|nr:phytoene desaturase family protein [Spirochaetia bacterium]